MCLKPGGATTQNAVTDDRADADMRGPTGHCLGQLIISSSGFLEQLSFLFEFIQFAPTSVPLQGLPYCFPTALEGTPAREDVPSLSVWVVDETPDTGSGIRWKIGYPMVWITAKNKKRPRKFPGIRNVHDGIGLQGLPYLIGVGVCKRRSQGAPATRRGTSALAPCTLSVAEAGRGMLTAMCTQV